MSAVKTSLIPEAARDVFLQRIATLDALQAQEAFEELVAGLAAVELPGITDNGMVVRTGVATYDTRTITGTANEITVTNGDGVAGDPTISLPTAIILTGKTLDEIERVGVNTTADSTNRLSVNSDAVLFNHNGTTSQVKVNKAATGNTASHLFQVGFSGRAEFGLIGSDDFQMKTSPDGSVFTTGLTILGSTAALRVHVNASPSANDGAALGTTALGWSDMFLASGAVLNFANGNVTITHASGAITVAGAATFSLGTSAAFTTGTIELGAATDTTLSRVSAGVVAIEGVNILTTATGQPLDSDLTAIAALTPSNDDIIQRKAGVWTNRTMAQLATDLDTFFLTPAEGSAAYQPLDADLTAIAALTTTAAGRSHLTFTDPNVDQISFWDDSAGAFAGLTHAAGLEISGTALRVYESFIVAASDETTNLTTGTAKVKWRMPYAFTVTDVRGSLSTAQTAGSIFTVDVNEGGTTILSTKLTIDNNELTSTTAATPRVISDTALADDAEMSVDIDQIGTAGARGLKVTIIGYRP